MINVKVKNYLITADDRNFTVRKQTTTKTNAKTGEEDNGYALVGYYRTMKMALVAIKKNMALTGSKEIKTVQEYINALGNAEQEININFDEVD